MKTRLPPILIAFAGLLAFPSALIHAQTTCTPPPPGLVAWWRAEGSANDSVGTNNGTLINGATFATGKVGRAFSFDGTSGVVQIPDSTSVSITGAISMDAWIKPTSVGAIEEILSKYNSLANQVSYAFEIRPGGGLRFAVYQTGNGSTVRYVDTAGGIVSTGTFTHVAATFNPVTQAIKIYVNGVDTLASLGAGSSIVTSIFDSTTPVRIGAAVDSGVGQVFFSGLIDEAELFNRELIASEIQSIFNAGSAGKCPPCAPAPSGLISWWRAEGSANDAVGTNNGSLINGATLAAGMVGQAFSFDGVDDFMEVTNAAFPQGNSPITIEFWMKGAPGGPSNDRAIMIGNPVPHQGLILGEQIANSHIRLIAVASTECESASVVFDNTWHHIAGVYDGATLKVYVDGTLENSCAYSSLNLSGSGITIGQQAAGFREVPEFFLGLLDEVSIYNRALSSSEIQRIFNAGSAGKCLTPSLQATRAGSGRTAISWTPNTPGYVLQESLKLSAPAWTNSPSGSTNPVTVPATLPAKFYRLTKP